MRLHRPTALLAGLALTLAACGGAGSTTTADEDGRPAVVVTTSILGDLVQQLVQEDAEVQVLMGPGVDPHAFQLSAAQAASLREADLVVANGLDLEESLLDTLEAAEEDGATVLEVAPGVDPIAYGEGEDHDDDGEDDHDEDEDEDHDDHGEFDPHVWQDAGRMAEAVELIAEAIAEVDDTLDDDEWEARGEALHDELLALDAELDQTLSAVDDDRRALVTNHEAFGYFADAYDFEIFDTVIPGNSTDVDTSAGDFVDLVELLRAEGVGAIFAENTTSDRLAEALAAEVGQDVKIVQLFSDALGEADSGAATYQELMRTNADLVVDALA